MNRKYLDDLGVKFKDTPQGWNPDDPRQEEWKKQRETYGFDERETWGLDYTFKLWLYERLSMYNEINCINTSFHEFEYKNKMFTQQECIDMILEGLKYDLTLPNPSPEREQHQEQIEDIIPLFSLIFYDLWW